MRTILRSSIVALALAGGQASAAPFGSLVFDTPTANVLSNEAIDVWVTFTLNSASSPLVLTGNANDVVTNGTLMPEEIPAKWLTLDSSRLNTNYLCTGTFTNACAPAAYSFQFTLPPSPNSVVFLEVIDLQPGQSTSYKFGTFTPVGGNAPAGTYEFFGSGLALELTGTAQETDQDGNLLFYAAGDQILDPFGNPILNELGEPVLASGGEPVIKFVQKSFDLANTRGDVSGGVSFIRNVTAVPEPATYAMLLAGLGLVGWRMYRNRA